MAERDQVINLIPNCYLWF